MPVSMIRPILAVALLGLSASASANDRKLRSERMPFQDCLAMIDEVAVEFGAGAMRMERTRDLRSARIDAEDGIITLVCSRTDQTVTLTRSAGGEARGGPGAAVYAGAKAALRRCASINPF